MPSSQDPSLGKEERNPCSGGVLRAVCRDDEHTRHSVVGHMNWPNATDCQRIDALYADLHALVKQLPGAGVVLAIP